jgi:L-arabinose isomerase
MLGSKNTLWSVIIHTRDGNAINAVMGHDNTLWTLIIRTVDGNASNALLDIDITHYGWKCHQNT